MIFVIGLIYTYAQTAGFGYHGIPQSATEAITDLSCVIFILTGVVLLTIGNALPRKI
jgi:hypothetical protein